MKVPKSGKMIFRKAKKGLKSFDAYHYWRYSPWAMNLEEKLWPRIHNQLEAERRLYQELFSNTSTSSNLVFDIGANQGYSAAIFLKYAKKVICVEPADYNIKCLQARFGKNSKVVILEKAISNKSGTATIHLQDDGTGLHTMNAKWKHFLEQANNGKWESAVSFTHQKEIETLTLDQLIAIYGKPFFIKIDVEGHEESVLKGLSQIVPYLCFEANLPQFLEETIRCVVLLKAIHPSARFNYSTFDHLIFEEYLDADKFIQFLNTTPLTYMDIFCSWQHV